MLKRGCLNILIALLGIVAALFLMELFLRLFFPQLPLQLKGMYVQDPILGFRLKPGFEGRQRTDEFDVRVKINSSGLRDYERALDADSFTVLAVGDSFVFGSWVDLDLSWLALLEEQLNERTDSFQVVKAGVPAYGIDQASLFVQNEGAAFAPDLVVLGIFVGNDVRDTLVGSELYHVEDGLLVWDPNVLKAWWGYDVLTGEWPNKPLDWPPAHWVQSTKFDLGDWLKKNSHLYHFVKRSYQLLKNSQQPSQTRRAAFWPSQDGLTIFDYETFYLKTYPEEVRKGFGLAFDYIEQLQAATEAMGAELLLVLIPTKAQVQHSYWEARLLAFALDESLVDPERPQQVIKDWAVEHEIHVFDLLPVFRQAASAQDEWLYFESDEHWNERGHRLAAEAVYDYLIDGHFVPE